MLFCSYSRNEDLTSPADFCGFDYLLTATPDFHESIHESTLYSPSIDGQEFEGREISHNMYALKNVRRCQFEVIEMVEGFDRFSVDLSWFDRPGGKLLKVTTKPFIYIMKRVFDRFPTA